MTKETKSADKESKETKKVKWIVEIPFRVKETDTTYLKGEEVSGLEKSKFDKLVEKGAIKKA